jgi:peptidoglycan/LPS O-acetylase OafA/YrhL
MVWLGRVSYSTYLCHVFVLEPFVALANPPLASLGVRGRLAALAVLAAVPVAAVSAVLYYLVEKPGIQCGKLVSVWLARRPAVPEPAVAAVEACTPPSV